MADIGKERSDTESICFGVKRAWLKDEQDSDERKMQVGDKECDKANDGTSLEMISEEQETSCKRWKRESTSEGEYFSPSEDVSDDEGESDTEEELQDRLVFPFQLGTPPIEENKSGIDLMLSVACEEDETREDRLLKLKNEILKLTSIKDAKNEEVNVYDRMITLKTQIQLILLRQENLSEAEEKLVRGYEEELAKLQKVSETIDQETYKDMYWRQFFEDNLSKPILQKHCQILGKCTEPLPTMMPRLTKSAVKVCEEIEIAGASMASKKENVQEMQDPVALLSPMIKSSESQLRKTENELTTEDTVNVEKNMVADPATQIGSSSPTNKSISVNLNRSIYSRATETLRAFKEKFISGKGKPASK